MRSASSHSGGFQTWALRASVLFAVVLGAYLIFELGRVQAGYSITDAAAERRANLEEVQNLEAQILGLEEQLALQETHREIDALAYQEVEASLGTLESKIQEQRDAIEFYRGILSPSDGGRGLRVQDLRVTEGASPDEVSVRLVLVQVLQHDRAVKGDVGFSIEGAQDGGTITYSLEELVPADEDSSWPFSFRYFQTFDRDLILPSGFKPERIHVEVRSRTRSISSVEQSFAWQAGQS